MQGGRSQRLAVALLVLAAMARPAAGAAPWFQPARGLRWQYQLSDQGAIAIKSGVQVGAGGTGGAHHRVMDGSRNTLRLAFLHTGVRD